MLSERRSCSNSLGLLVRLHAFLVRLELLHLLLFFGSTPLKLLLERHRVERLRHSHLRHASGNALFGLLHHFLATGRPLLMHLFETFQPVFDAHVTALLFLLLFHLSALERSHLLLSILARHHAAVATAVLRCRDVLAQEVQA